MPTRRSLLAAAGVLTAATIGSSLAKSGPRTFPAGLTLLSIRNTDGSETLGIRTSRGVIDVRRAMRLLRRAAPLTLGDMLRDGSAGELQRLAAEVQERAHAAAAIIDEASITHGRLFTNPGKIVCIGLNYRAHAAESNTPPPRVPVLFNKYNNALAAHGCRITLPPPDIAYKFDYETELLIVIGKTARNVAAVDALEHVAGYCTSQDFSARDLQSETPGGQWMVGKTLDNFGPIGPYFVSADLVGDPGNLKIETRVNGELRQSASTGDMIFGPRQLIAYITKLWTLEPGDIIFTGTPAGVIAGLPKDRQIWLKAGDEVTSSIEKLGELNFSLT